jgi:hypothetical protein
MQRYLVWLITALLLLGSTSALAGIVSLTASKDTTIFSQDDEASNALGILFTSPTSGGNIRRSLLNFDVAEQVPAGATITRATLALTLIEGAGGTGDVDHSLHRLLQDWGEGTSSTTSGKGAPATPGDATWRDRFFPNETWSNPGGDFVASPSAMMPIGLTPGAITWGPTPEMIADVQSWLDSPSESHGWIVLGDEDSLGTARKFFNRENADPTVRPVLNIEFRLPEANVPTLSQLGLAVMALLMLGFGVLGLSRTR